VERAVACVLDVAVHHRGGRAQARRRGTTDRVHPAFRVYLVGADDLTDLVDEYLGCGTGYGVESRVSEALVDVSVRPFGAAACVFCLLRGDGVDV
jgi:hypothetical protein